MSGLRACMCAVFAALLLFGASPATHAAGYAETKYPIVLVHGLFGFDSLLGVDYFYGIPGNLRANGAKVFVAEVSAANSTEVRGEQLLAQVNTILALTGASKVNLIGHSHGGPTIRYVAGVAPGKVASVTSIGGVNKGSRVADLLRHALPAGSFTEAIVTSTANALANIITALSGAQSPQSSTAALNSLTTTGAAAFNQKFPQGLPANCGNGADLVNGVRYFSWAGVRRLTNVLDISDGALGILGLQHNGQANDGLVTACSARLGRSLGDYQQNHLDEVNQILGFTDIFSVSPVTLYREHANRLKWLGL